MATNKTQQYGYADNATPITRFGTIDPAYTASQSQVPQETVNTLKIIRDLSGAGLGDKYLMPLLMDQLQKGVTPEDPNATLDRQTKEAQLENGITGMYDTAVKSGDLSRADSIKSRYPQYFTGTPNATDNTALNQTFQAGNQSDLATLMSNIGSDIGLDRNKAMNSLQILQNAVKNNPTVDIRDFYNKQYLDKASQYNPSTGNSITDKLGAFQDMVAQKVPFAGLLPNSRLFSVNSRTDNVNKSQLTPDELYNLLTKKAAATQP